MRESPCRGRIIKNVTCWRYGNPIQDELFRGCSRIEGGKKALTKICYTYPTVMKLSSYTLAKKDPKNMWIVGHTFWVLLTWTFFTGNQQILLYPEMQV